MASPDNSDAAIFDANSMGGNHIDEERLEREMTSYQIRLDERTEECYQLAGKARSKGLDHSLEVEIPRANDLAGRTEKLLVDHLDGLEIAADIRTMLKEFENDRETTAIKIAQKLGKDSFYEYIRKFGFGEKTSIRLPGVSSGLLGKRKNWNERSLASISFGQEIAVTPLQMVVALSAIANGGTLMEPHIAKALMRDGKIIKEIKPKKIRRVISEKTSRQMMEILKFVVENGTGKKAAIDGFEVAGKPGTAQKYITETQSYSKTEFISSFIGYAPADNPQLAILVMIDNPKGRHWGGVVAAPVFVKIAEKSLRHLNVTSSKERIFILDRA